MNTAVDANGLGTDSPSTYRSIFVPCKPNTTYTVSKTLDSTRNRFTVGYTTTTPTYGTSVSGLINDNTKSALTITTGADAKYLVAYVWITGGTESADDMVGSVQVELGSTATAYAPYLEPLELAKIGTYQDRIYKTDGKWYVEKQVGKVVLDESEDGWTFQPSNAPFRYRLTGSYSTYDDASTFISDYFQSVAWNVSWAKYDYLMSPNSGNNVLVFRYTGISTLEDFKTWLSTHPTTVYYALATPTITQITNQTLIDQLEALAGATLNQGVNNIWIEIATGNAMPTLELNWVEWEKHNRHNVYIWNDDIDDWQVIVQ